ncbi:hypothetical protein, partial [Streptomyces sp. NPDC051014]|uniref:hypothetical protein n=1 Tax=Streptomyces sp. NPDC051014 TaxID=3155751 RepID=UPI0033DB1901
TQVAADLAAVVVHPEVLGVWKELLGSLARTGLVHCVPVVWEGSNTTGAAAPGGDTPLAPQPFAGTAGDREILGAIHAGCATMDLLGKALGLDLDEVKHRVRALAARAGIPRSPASNLLKTLLGCYPITSGVWSGLDLSELPTLQQIHVAAQGRKRKRHGAPSKGDLDILGAIQAGDRTVADLVVTLGIAPEAVTHRLLQMRVRAGMGPRGAEGVLRTLLEQRSAGEGAWAGIDLTALPTAQQIHEESELRKRGSWTWANREVLAGIHAGDRTIDALAKTIGRSRETVRDRLADLGKRAGLAETATDQVLETLLRDYPGRGVWTGINLHTLPTRHQIRAGADHRGRRHPGTQTPGGPEVLGAIHAGDRTVGAVAETIGHKP